MQEKDVKRELTAKVLGIVLLVIYGTYAVISSIVQFSYGRDGLAEGLITLFLGGVFCTIIGLSFFGKWAAFLRKMRRHEDADAMDAAYQDAIAPLRKAPKIKLKPKRNDLIASIAVLLLGLGVAAVCWYFAARGFAKLHAPYFIKTEAMLQVIDGQLFYKFVDLNGNEVLAPSNISVAGVQFYGGFSTTVYYHSLHPEVLRQATIYIVLCGAGIFGAAIGVLVCLHQLNIDLNYLLGFPAAAIFIGVPLCFEIAIANITGYPFFRLLVGGTPVYACNGMLMLGIYFLIVAINNVIKRAKGYSV